MAKLISGIYKSIVRGTTDLIATIGSTTSHSVQYHDWENRADEDKLPQATLLGVDGFSFEEQEGLWAIRYGLTLSSFRDTNLLNEVEILDVIHEHTGEGRKVFLRDPNTGAVVSELVTAAWHLTPMGTSQHRNYRSIGIELLRTAS